MSTQKSLYEIANDWDGATDEEVVRFKNAITPNIKKDGLGVVCRKEWVNGTFIDIYIFSQDRQTLLRHLVIDQDDNFGEPTEDF